MKLSDMDDGENFLYWATGKSPRNEPVEDDLNINDIRQKPLRECRSFGDLMATIKRCKSLDQRDKRRKIR